MNEFSLVSAAVVLGLCGAMATAQPITRLISPMATDPAIVDVELPNADGFLRDHFVSVDMEASARGRLFLCLPGTGGTAAQYQAVTNLSAILGYDAIALVYDNWPSVNGLTTNDPDPELPEKIRRERLFGEPQTELIDVDEANSVVNRVEALLAFLVAVYPEERWGRYLDADGGINWSRVVVAGHSQGAGHAAYLSKQFRLGGVMMLAGPGDFVQDFGPAPWLELPAETSPSRLFALTHLQDPGTPSFFTTQTILGLAAFGAIQNVDGLPFFAITSHMLTSTVDPGHNNFHSAVAVDEFLPLNPTGQPVYLTAWASMLQRLMPTPVCQADLNGDGLVNSEDLGCVLAGFGCVGFGCVDDVTVDGVVDSNDLGLVLAAFGGSCD